MQTWTNCLIKTCLPLASELPALGRRAGFNIFYAKSQELVLASCSTTVHSIEQIPRASSFPSLPIPLTPAEMLLAACPSPGGPETVVFTQKTEQKCCFQYIFNKPAHGAARGGGQSSVCAAGLAQKGWHKRFRARCRPPQHIISSPGGFFLGQGGQIWRNFTRKEHCGGVFWSLAAPRAEQAGTGTFFQAPKPPKGTQNPQSCFPGLLQRRLRLVERCPSEGREVRRRMVFFSWETFPWFGYFLFLFSFKWG